MITIRPLPPRSGLAMHVLRRTAGSTIDLETLSNDPTLAPELEMVALRIHAVRFPGRWTGRAAWDPVENVLYAAPPLSPGSAEKVVRLIQAEDAGLIA